MNVKAVALNTDSDLKWKIMTMTNPKNQTTDIIVESLLNNTSRQYTESAHAEIFRRLINTMKEFNEKTEKIEKVMLYLAAAQVVLALTQIIIAMR